MPRGGGPAGSASAAAASLSGLVIEWQLRHGRHTLPWQGTRDPYRVWLSEVMLQQTQVSVVVERYAAFLQRFPDVLALAASPLDDVLAQWSGMGYYSRARNLHRTAQAVADGHGGRLPATAAALAELPGIGRSTAAAIAVFCFGERAAILDGNVKRVLTRAVGFAGDLSLAGEQRALWQRAEDLLPEQGIEAYTQGLMDLGATVCLARQPRCDACPLATRCVARAEGRPQRYPVRTRTSRRGQRCSTLLWLRRRGMAWLVQRPAPGVWASLWCLPEFTTTDEARQCLQGHPGRECLLPVIEHRLTHFDWTIQTLQWQLPDRVSDRRAGQITAALPAGRWVGETDARALGIPAPLRRLLGG